MIDEAVVRAGVASAAAKKKRLDERAVVAAEASARALTRIAIALENVARRAAAGK